MFNWLKSKWVAGCTFLGLTGSASALTNDLTEVQTKINEVVTAGGDTFDLIIPIVFAVVGLSVALFFFKKIYKAK